MLKDYTIKLIIDVLQRVNKLSRTILLSLLLFSLFGCTGKGEKQLGSFAIELKAPTLTHIAGGFQFAAEEGVNTASFKRTQVDISMDLYGEKVDNAWLMGPAGKKLTIGGYVDGRMEKIEYAINYGQSVANKTWVALDSFTQVDSVGNWFEISLTNPTQLVPSSFFDKVQSTYSFDIEIRGIAGEVMTKFSRVRIHWRKTLSRPFFSLSGSFISLTSAHTTEAKDPGSISEIIQAPTLDLSQARLGGKVGFITQGKTVSSVIQHNGRAISSTTAGTVHYEGVILSESETLCENTTSPMVLERGWVKRYSATVPYRVTIPKCP